MTGRFLILVSAAALCLLAFIFAIETWFCISAFKAKLAGCAAEAGQAFLTAPLRIIAFVLAVLGLVVGFRLNRK
jgi:hypothetical protein